MLANQLWKSPEHIWKPPIHIAVSRGNLKAVEFLLENGADVNRPDDCLRTALHVAVNSKPRDMQQLMDLLISRGARLEALDSNGCTPLGYASHRGCWDSVKFLLDVGANPAVLTYLSGNVLHLSTMGCSSGYKTSFASFLTLGVNPHHMNSFGVSPMQYAMCRDQFAVVFLNGDYGVQNTEPFPWHIFHVIGTISWLTTKFPMFQRRISPDDLHRIANTEPSFGWSPLCLSASQGAPIVIESLLTLGADLEFEGCPAGTALMAACDAGRLESVIALVRRGAALSYYGSNGFRTAIDKTKTSPHILRWLLVSRFTDQAKIKEEPQEISSTGPPDIRPWSGIKKAELVISENLERRPDQSSKDYWIYLMDQKKQWRGKVVPIVDRRRTVRPSNLIPMEKVRIHPGGYETPLLERSKRSERPGR